MSKPLVSIILPVYNAQNHIARCLESICAQSWQNIEVIVLNDGSKDQSLPVCEAFRAKDERIVLVDKANSGVSDTRNLGLKLASGKYVQFVDSDDYIDPDFTEHLVTAAEQNNADLVIAPYKMVIPAGASKPEQVLDKLQDELGVMTVARPPEVREYGFLPAGVYTQDEFARHLMDKPASYFYGVLWNKLYRRDLLVDHQIQFTSEVRWAEDLVFNMQYLEYANVLVSIPEAGYYYVQNPQSICHTQINPATLVQNKIQVFRYYKDLYTRLGMYEQVRPQLYKFLVDIAESTYPSGPFKEVIDEAKAYWKDAREDVQTRTAEARERWNGMREELRETAQERSAEWKARHDSDPKEYAKTTNGKPQELARSGTASRFLCDVQRPGAQQPMAAHFLASHSRSSSFRRGASFSNT